MHTEADRHRDTSRDMHSDTHNTHMHTEIGRQTNTVTCTQRHTDTQG